MQDVFKIAPVVRREALTIMLSMEATSENVTTVHFYSYTRDKVEHTGRAALADVEMSKP